MPLHIGIGFSQHEDVATAVQQAAQAAKQQLNRERIDAAIIFNTVHYNTKEFVPLLYKALDQTKIVGASCAGLLLSDRIEMRGLGILAVHSESIRFETGYIEHLDMQSPNAAGQALAKNYIADFGEHHRKFLLLFCEGLLNNFSPFLQAMKSQLNPSLSLFGAAASDDFRFSKTFQYYQHQMLSSSAVGLSWGGQMEYAAACGHGWRPLGKPRRITQATGHIIKTIDGKKAVEIYEKFFETGAAEVKSDRLGDVALRYPLGTYDEPRHEYLIRNVIDVLDDGSLVCQDTVAVGARVHIMIGNKESCLRAALEAAESIKEQLSGRNPQLLIVIESLLRYKILGRSARQELQLISKVFGQTIPVFGMYSNGEIFTPKTPDKTAPAIFQNGSLMFIAIY